MKRKRILDRVGEQKFERKLMSLKVVGGRVWSFDGSLTVCIFFLYFTNVEIECHLTSHQ